MYLTFN